MDEKITEKIERLKRDGLETEQLRLDERKTLLKVIQTFGLIMDMHSEFLKEYQAIKKILDTDQKLPLGKIETEVQKLKSKIFAEETKKTFDARNQLNELKTRLLKSCRILKKIMIALLDNFYPITGELKTKADSIDITCHEEMAQMDLEAPATAFLSFISELKEKISDDFRYINKTFLMLLGHVKELEKTLSSELGQDVRLKEIEEFETNVNHEMGSIADSFNIHSTIDEIKSAVVAKLTKIKEMVSKRKKEEMEKAQKTQENINRLKKKITDAERDARIMSKKAVYFQTAATKDGLTGLYNRKAFDMRITDALKAFGQERDPLSLVLFDVDKFKWINDTLGHVAGDKILIKVAQCLKETFRKNDFIARYGGDEFAVVIEGLDEEMARKKILNFRDNFGKKRFFSHNIGDVTVTVSAGIAMAADNDNANDFINRADRNMYKAKKNKS